MRAIKIFATIIMFFAALMPLYTYAGNIDEAGNDSYLTRMVKDESNIYVMGTYKSERIWVHRFDKEDVDTTRASWELKEGGNVKLWAGSSSYNGAMCTDESGNVYLAATRGVGAKRQIMIYKLTEDPADTNGNLTLARSIVIGSMTTSNPNGTIFNPEARGITVDTQGNIYVVGDTREELIEWDDPVYDFDIFQNYDSKGSTQRRIGFVAKLDADMNLKAYTYIGSGSNSSTSAANAVLSDGSSIYVLGRDASGQIPKTAGSLQEELNASTSYSDTFDAFITKMDAGTLEATVSTYYGGTGTEEVADMKIVGQNLYVLGDTTSNDLRVSDAPYSSTHGSKDSFYPSVYVMRVHKSLKYTDSFAATYFGDATSSRIDAFAMDVEGGHVYITGTAKNGSSIPVTDGSNKGHIFVADLQSNLSGLHTATLMGSDASGDSGRGICQVNDKLILAGTKGTEGPIDNYICQPFIEAFNTNISHARLVRIEMDTFSNEDRTFKEGEEIVIRLTFDANVKVTGTPTLELNIQNKDRTSARAEYISGSGTDKLIFKYTVQKNDTTKGNRLMTVGDNPIGLTDANISPWAGDDRDVAILEIPTENDNRLEYSYGDRVFVDATSPEETGDDEKQGEEGKQNNDNNNGSAQGGKNGNKNADVNGITPNDAAANSARVDKKIPRITKINTTASVKSGKIVLNWPKVKGATNYRVAYKTAKTTKWNYKWTAAKTSCSIAKMNKNGLYDFKVSAYKKSNGTWTRGDWSPVNYRYYNVVKGIKVKVLKGRKAKVSWKKQSGPTGYQVLYSKSKKMTNPAVKTVKGAKKKAYTIKKLKKGKRYYIKVRSYKTYKGKKYIGILGKNKTIKAK